MRSLKIILFRDTDKPYTMIIPASLIVAVSFSLIALVSLLTFSIMGNVMLFNFGGVKEAGSQTAAAADEVYEGEENAEPGPADTDDTQASTDTGEVEPESQGWEEINAETNKFDVEVAQGPNIANGRIVLRVLIAVKSEHQVDGVRHSGRYVMALLNKENQVVQTFPEAISIENREVQNPDRGFSFTIGNRQFYEGGFQADDLEVYSSIVFFIFDDESSELVYRGVVPIQ